MAACRLACGISVGLFAVLLGLLYGGFLQPLITFQDGYNGSRGTFFKGMLPVHHKGIPWGFTIEDMPDLKGEWDTQLWRLCVPLRPSFLRFRISPSPTMN